jgi:hypothetical protein
MTVDKELRSPTAREIVAKLHPSIQKDWLEKLLRVEDEALQAELGAEQIFRTPSPYRKHDDDPDHA